MLVDKRVPLKIQTSKGSEFLNENFQKFLKNKYIDFFTTHSELKASVIERFNRTLKERMWRYFTKANTYKYIYILPDMLYNNNHSFHRTIKTFPANVTFRNESKILNNTYRITKQDDPFKFNIGDKVRISKIKRHFEKGYWPNWTEEYFIIHDRLARNPPVYKIKDQMGEILRGLFYEYEIQKIDPDNNEPFVIEKFIKTRRIRGKTDYLVRWRGYPQSLTFGYQV